MNREDFIKVIPKPENKDVILYNIDLQDLIDVNVLQEYEVLYDIFTRKKKRYLELKTKISEYEKSIDNIYLFQHSWTESDYLQNLQNYKKTYSTLYGPIKKAETNINILKKKIVSINEKIKIQLSKESKKIKAEKENIDDDIERDRQKIMSYKAYLETYKMALKQLEEQLKINQQNFEDFVNMEKQFKDGECKCELCGRTIKNTDENSLIYKRLASNIEKNKKELEKIISQKEKVDTNIEYYQGEIQKLRAKMNNNLEFRKEVDNFYQKKSVEILKLEADRDMNMNEITKLENQLKSSKETQSKQYLELKNKIDKCELSLENLTRIKELKEQYQNETQEFSELKSDLKSMISKINHYLEFIKIYFKILEQKANDFCGTDYKFSFYKIEEFEFIPFLNLQYKGCDYSELDQKTRDEIDKFLMQKFSIYS